MTGDTSHTRGTAAAGGHGGASPNKRRTWWASTRIIVSVLIVAAVIIFIVQNRDTTRVTFLVADILSPLWAILAGVAVVGVILGYLVAVRRR